MTTSIFKRLSLSKSSRKSQVTSIDAVISYMIFALFLVQVTLYVQKLSSPFASYLETEILYKNTASLNEMYSKSSATREYIENLCVDKPANVLDVKLSYEVKGLSMPFFDGAANESLTGVHITRRNNKMRIYFNTNTTTQFEIVIPTREYVDILMQNTESYDYYNKTRSGEADIIKIFANNTGEDADIFEIIIDDKLLVMLNNYYIDPGEVYVGAEPLYYSCGTIRALPKKSFYSSYSLLSDMGAVVSYGVDVWWE